MLGLCGAEREPHLCMEHMGWALGAGVSPRWDRAGAGVSGGRCSMSEWDGAGAGVPPERWRGAKAQRGGCRGLPPDRGGGRGSRTPRTDPGGPGRKGRPSPAMPIPPGAARAVVLVRSCAEPSRRAPAAGTRSPGQPPRAHRVRPQHNQERPPPPRPCLRLWVSEPGRDPGGGAWAEDHGAVAWETSAGGEGGMERGRHWQTSSLGGKILSGGP